jgi:sugar phosphate isomerase/epimerase
LVQTNGHFVFARISCLARDMENPIAVSSWSVHRMLGISHDNGPAHMAPTDVGPFMRHATWGEGEFSLLQLPAALAARGYGRCEICHFHIGDLSRNALGEIRTAFEAAGVIIQTLLIDDGDLTHPATRARDMAWIARWIDVAADIGAENARVVAGKAAPTAEALSLAIDGLKPLVAQGQARGVNIVTENWFETLSTPTAVHHVLDHVAGLGFLADTGNWSGTTKYADLQSIFARASLCHAKASLAPGQILDSDDFGACLNAARAAGYGGPFTLIFADDGDEWQGLEIERHFIAAHGS